ncbi:hypothetical protein PR202_gb12641 [Eleusine coracana subsp. coracana]|uniref:Uncharacterized protein n=1 Tax=Eleusine coracana subsp. coracana TaxID=191504 RepID=A0AAV5ERM4_ELECO|nr:hypothetical protein PR202_gb12641 [Eleusine coracana subsp. coracana]
MESRQVSPLRSHHAGNSFSPRTSVLQQWSYVFGRHLLNSTSFGHSRRRPHLQAQSILRLCSSFAGSFVVLEVKVSDLLELSSFAAFAASGDKELIIYCS